MPSSLPESSPFRAGVLPETQVLLAGQDLLTGLSSRSGLEAHFRLAAARARRSGARFAVGLVTIGVDPTQPPDEVFGHDLLVVEAAKRLRAALRETDLVARLGETRFAFIAEEVTPEARAVILRRVLRALTAPGQAAGSSAAAPRSQVGLALWENGDQTFASLLREAERALTADEPAENTMPAAANAESFGLEDDPAPLPPASPARRAARRAIGWLSLAALVALALAATPAGWRDRWLPLERMAAQGWSELQVRVPVLGAITARRP